MAPKLPHARTRAGKAVAVLGHGVRDIGGPELAPSRSAPDAIAAFALGGVERAVRSGDQVVAIVGIPG